MDVASTPQLQDDFVIFGSNRPYRIKMRPATFYACQALPRMIEQGMIADVIAIIGSTDVVMGDVDR